jgi:phage tail sheath protein FI
MARSINSPGVQITETDLSNYQQPVGGTTVFIPGFAAQGPTDEVLLVTSVTDLEQIYGVPETAAERYFFYSAKEVLNSPATVLTTRLPYGSGSGEGFTEQYSALLYPVASSASGFEIGQPKHITFGEADYSRMLQNNVTWSALTSSNNTASYSNGAIEAGIVVINAAQTTVNEFFEGYYVSITDNTNFGPDSNFDSVTTFNTLTGNQTDFYSIPSNSTRLGFSLSSTKELAGTNSVSEVIESIPTYNFGDAYYNDSLILNIFKVRNSIYEPQILTYSLAESYIGSLDSNKKTLGITNAGNRSFFIGDIANNTSANIKVLINPNISQKTNWASLTSINPNKNVRIATNNKAVYANGVYLPTYEFSNIKDIGNLKTKIERALTLVETTETINVDIVVDGGLSTIFANASGVEAFDDTKYVDTSISLANENSNTIQRWREVFNTFNNFVVNTRKDCIFIADPLRQIFVNGENTKTLSVRGSTFTSTIYTPIKNLYSSINTNYATTYGNWVKIYDAYADKFVWQPISGFVAAAFARSDSATQPWIAPAGLTRGVLNNVVDLAFNPNQKQRDFLYTISVNPVVSFSNEGFVIFGQKTLQNKPSAFDRINVRRLFLALEKATNNALKYYVFEPNTAFIRTRLKNTISPIFELAKNTDGLYDFLIVCDERNNTPDVIDRNELVVDIYIKPVKAAEFILVNFIATRTGQNFSELI